MLPDPLSKAEHNFIVSTSSKGSRLDGRGKLEYRKFAWKHYSPGCLDLHLGGTRISVTVREETARPAPNRPNEGTLSFSVNPSSMAAVGYSRAKKAQVSAEVKNLLEIAIKKNKVVDLESLCIKSGAWVWKLQIHLTIVCDDGNIFDAAVLATMLGLKTYKLPETRTSGDEITVYTVLERNPHALTIHHCPFAITFNMDSGYVEKQTENVLVDATSQEEMCFSSRLVLVLNTQGELCATYQVGPVCLPAEDLARLSNYALDKVADLSLMFNHAFDS